jgi:F-type H+-transporting ATPase subunit a
MMGVKDISPDAVVVWKWGFATLNATILYTWGIMILMTLGAWLITRRLATGPEIPRWQNVLEVVVLSMRNQIRSIMGEETDIYLPFIGTLFLYIAVANLLTILPVYDPPTASLSTTAGLALCVILAVVIFGIAKNGFLGFLKQYLKPSPVMLPFNVIGEASRTLALAVRLFGNVMSGTKIVGILLAVAPLFFPAIMRVFGVLTGVLQAYIFAVLAAVYIASAARAHRRGAEDNNSNGNDQGGSHG